MVGGSWRSMPAPGSARSGVLLTTREKAEEEEGVSDDGSIWNSDNVTMAMKDIRDSQ